MRTPGTVNAQVLVYAAHGHRHLFTVTDPSLAELDRLCKDRHVEVVTTDGDDYVEVITACDPDHLLVKSPDGQLYIL